MFWTLFLVLSFVYATRAHPTSCAEDSHCSSGFFCEETHECRECFRCEELLRAPPLPLPRDYCAKSLFECGPCRKGLVQAHEGVMNGLCSAPATERPAPLLPLYAWAAIAASLLLMIVILCLFAKMKTFKIAYAAARTSVQSLPTEPRPEYHAPPPPYHNVDGHLPSSPHHEESQNAFELQKLVESPHHVAQCALAEMRPREHASSQAARAFHSPAYVRPPLLETSTSSELPAQSQDEVVINNIVAVTPDGDQAVSPRTNNDAITGVVASGKSSHSGSTSASSSLRKQRADLEVAQDSNNNCPAADASSSQQTRRSAPYCANVINGPSFVINVVENITKSTIPHSELHT